MTKPDKPITTSIFDLFKVGPGPSSSHTIGPMKAGLHFRQLAEDAPKLVMEADAVQVELLGSLSATGKGHGTDRAVAAGMLGYKPENIDPKVFADLLNPGSMSNMQLLGKSFPLGPVHILFGPLQHKHPYQNTLIIRLMRGPEVLMEKAYYSTGGGFIRWEGYVEPEVGDPVYPYSTMTKLQEIIRDTGLSLPEVMMANEEAITGDNPRAISLHMDNIVAAMEAAVARGLHTDDVLPGAIGLRRKAPVVVRRSTYQPRATDKVMVLMNAYALAASEENAAGNIVVTAPTSGSAGVLPGIIHFIKKHHRTNKARVRNGLLAACAVGFLAKHNASIAGAEVGCQGEIGVASAMAAALLAQSEGHSPEVVANAAEIALEHHLGMTCDPVGGYVQIPCIERNAMGAIKAYNAFLLARAGDAGRQKVNLDQAIEVMLQTGRDMSNKYKETSLGGLALSLAEC